MTTTLQEILVQAREAITEIGPEQLLAFQAQGAPLIDVREPGEFAAGRLPGAVNIPRGMLEFEVDGHPAVNGVRDPALGHRDRPAILYCRSGGRSALAAEALKRLGFTQPLSLAGGFAAWTAAGRPVELDPKQ